MVANVNPINEIQPDINQTQENQTYVNQSRPNAIQTYSNWANVSQTNVSWTFASQTNVSVYVSQFELNIRNALLQQDKLSSILIVNILWIK